MQNFLWKARVLLEDQQVLFDQMKRVASMDLVRTPRLNRLSGQIQQRRGLFDRLFWAKWTLRQRGLPKDICNLIVRGYLRRREFHLESQHLREERISMLRQFKYHLNVKRILDCLRFCTSQCRSFDDTHEIMVCDMGRIIHYPLNLWPSEPCHHRFAWIRLVSNWVF